MERITAVDIATGERTTLAEVPLCIDNLSFDVADRLFVSFADDGHVTEETGGRTRMLSEPGLCGPHGLAVAADGTVLFADGVGAGRHPPQPPRPPRRTGSAPLTRSTGCRRQLKASIGCGVRPSPQAQPVHGGVASKAVTKPVDPPQSAL